MISFEELLAAADTVKPDAGGTTEPYAIAITGADVAFGIYPLPELPKRLGLMVLRGEVTCGRRPENWSCVYCVGEDHAQALADTFGKVGPGGLSMAEASRALDRLAAQSAKDTKMRLQAMN